MTKTDIRFLTKNSHKAAEFSALFEGTRFNIIPDPTPISEIQTEDMEELVTDKVIKAFDKIRHPVFVDHTGLYFDLLNGFPGGLTEIFWNRVKNLGIAKLIGQSDTPGVKAVTLIGYCDGKSVKIFRGELHGRVPESPRGPEGFQWDPVFQPNDFRETFAEMGIRKNDISMRRHAVNSFIAYLKGN